jgi:error-prone DNA polymerase
MDDFVHLHVHSCYSFHDGTDRPAELAARAARLGYRALALTDTNGLYGAVPFVKAASEEGITPILGVHLDGGSRDGPRVLVLGRAGEEGYAALCRLVTARHLRWSKGERGEPGAAGALRNLREGLAEEARRVIVMTPSPKLLRTMAEFLPHRSLYGELIYTGDAASAGRCRATIAVCRSLGRPVAASNAVRFSDAANFELHRALRAIGEKSTVWQVRRLRRGVRRPSRSRAPAVPLPRPPRRGNPIFRPLEGKLRGAEAPLSPPHGKVRRASPP